MYILFYSLRFKIVEAALSVIHFMPVIRKYTLNIQEWIGHAYINKIVQVRLRKTIQTFFFIDDHLSENLIINYVL